MQCRRTFDVVVRLRAAALKLLPRKDQAQLAPGNACLVLNLRLDMVDGVARVYPQDDGLACQSLHEDLHAACALAFARLVVVVVVDADAVVVVRVVVVVGVVVVVAW